MMKHIFYAFLAAASLCACNNIQPSLKPAQLSIGANLKNPVGMNLEDSSLSWQIPFGANVSQSAYRIQVFSGDKIVADSGKVASGASVRVANPLKNIGSRQKFSWRVKIWDANGAESPWSDSAIFEAGLLQNSDWRAKWISSPDAPRPLYKTPQKAVQIYGENRMGYPPTLLRKSFDARKAVSSARLYVASKGIFNVALNGEKIGKDFWGTGWTDPAKRVQSNTYDVTALVREGKNVLSAIIADGWYSGRIRRDAKFVKPEFIAQLEITFADGTTQIVATDATWKASSGGALYADIYDGESYDAALEPQNWRLPPFDDSAWRAAAAMTRAFELPTEQIASPLPDLFLRIRSEKKDTADSMATASLSVNL